jgi:tRNA (guanine37-N1)-methyltransferase
MRTTIVTLFPEMFTSFLDASLLGKARQAGAVTIDFCNPRDFARDRHATVDDAPYGGGPGMVLKAEPVLAAIEQVVAQAAGPVHRVLLSPAGAPVTQARVRELAALPHVLLVCGRYEGIDQRVVDLAIDEELSIGDFVLSGGEPAAMALVDAVCRHVPGVLGEPTSVDEESFSGSLLEYPHYTRPAEVRGRVVPEVLQGGNHAAIRRWRREQSLLRTAVRRPDLLARVALDDADRAHLAEPAPARRDLGTLASRTTLALLHHPVRDRADATVTTSVTNLDVHDTARSAATFGLAGVFVVTPIAAQREMVDRILTNLAWEIRYDERGQALARVRVAAGLAEVVAAVAAVHGVRPRVVATSARLREGAVPPSVLAAAARADEGTPLLLVFGTGYGLADEVFTMSDQVLRPIGGTTGFNHLSVRSAVAIVLDRLFGDRAE